MKLGYRANLRRKELGLSIRALAEKIGVSHSAINMMEQRDYASVKYVTELADALDVSVEWLLSGEGLKEISTKIHALPVVPLNWLDGSIIGEPKILPTVTEMYRVFGKDQITEWIPVMNDFQDRGLAITVHGDSMISPSGHSFPDGSKAIFELYPNGRKLQTADLVLARMLSSDKVTFKKYVEEAGHRYLAPLNPHYPIIDDEFTVLAVYQFGIVY